MHCYALRTIVTTLETVSLQCLNGVLRTHVRDLSGIYLIYVKQCSCALNDISYPGYRCHGTPILIDRQNILPHRAYLILEISPAYI